MSTNFFSELKKTSIAFTQSLWKPFTGGAGQPPSVESLRAFLIHSMVSSKGNKGRLMLQRTVWSVQCLLQVNHQASCRTKSSASALRWLLHVPVKYSPRFLSRKCNSVLLVGCDLRVMQASWRVVTVFWGALDSLACNGDR